MRIRKKNIKKHIKFISLFVMILIFSSYSPVLAYKAGTSTKAGKQRFSEKGLKDNRYFIYYIDSTITNLGSEEDINEFTHIVKRDIICQFLYMRFLFGYSWREIREVQSRLIKLYRKKLGEEIKATEKILNKFAPLAIQSKDAKARLYLRLGYRNTRLAKIEMGMADAYKPTLYSMRLYKYAKAMKKVKEGKRFAILVLIQNNLTPYEKIKEKKYDFEKISELIKQYADKEDLEYLQLIHLDSYYKYKTDLSLYDKIWENPELEKYDVFTNYLEEINK